MKRWLIRAGLAIGALVVLWPTKAEAKPRRSSLTLYSQERLWGYGYSKEMTKRILAVQSYIAEYSALYGVDPALVSAVIKCESGFRSDVVSSAGAVGLMQLMPNTKKGWANELGIEGESTNPAFNIRLGTYGLGKLLKRWNGNVSRALASYNWGIGNVTKFPDGPYPKETQNYIQCVTSNQKRFEKAML